MNAGERLINMVKSVQARGEHVTSISVSPHAHAQLRANFNPEAETIRILGIPVYAEKYIISDEKVILHFDPREWPNFPQHRRWTE